MTTTNEQHEPVVIVPTDTKSGTNETLIHNNGVHDVGNHKIASDKNCIQKESLSNHRIQQTTTTTTTTTFLPMATTTTTTTIKQPTILTIHSQQKQQFERTNSGLPPLTTTPDDPTQCTLEHYRIPPELLLQVPQQEQEQQQYNNNERTNQNPYVLVRRSTIGQSSISATSVATKNTPVHYGHSLLCGFIAGIAQAGLFNPYDRALYLSMKNNIPFLHANNWKYPYRGLFQSISGRTIQGGLYFPLEHFFIRCIVPDNETIMNSNNNRTRTSTNTVNMTDSSLPSELQQQFNYFLAGTMAGAVNAFILNPLSVIKYKTWEHTTSNKPAGMIQEVKNLYKKSNHAIYPFFIGLVPTLYRDIVFGGIYTYLRLQLPVLYDNYIVVVATTSGVPDHVPNQKSNYNEQQQQQQQQQQHKSSLSSSSVQSSHNSSTNNHNHNYQYQYISNFIAAGLATIASGPFNYVRNIQYGTKSGSRPLSTFYILQNLIQEVKGVVDNNTNQTKTIHFLKRIHYLQRKLRIGWGTARVALGMTFAHFIYDTMYEITKNDTTTTTERC